MSLKTYSELCRLPTLQDRYEYLRLQAEVGLPTFGAERYLNQSFYSSALWKQTRTIVIMRDWANDLGVEGQTIARTIYVHHMNPITVEQVMDGDEVLLDPEYLISVSFRTHNAIHYGDQNQLPQPLVERRPGDTQLW
jgi:hypothetical protein